MQAFATIVLCLALPVSYAVCAVSSLLQKIPETLRRD